MTATSLEPSYRLAALSDRIQVCSRQICAQDGCRRLGTGKPQFARQAQGPGLDGRRTHFRLEALPASPHVPDSVLRACHVPIVTKSPMTQQPNRIYSSSLDRVPASRSILPIKRRRGKRMLRCMKCSPLEGMIGLVSMLPRRINVALDPGQVMMAVQFPGSP